MESGKTTFHSPLIGRQFALESTVCPCVHPPALDDKSITTHTQGPNWREGEGERDEDNGTRARKGDE